MLYIIGFFLFAFVVISVLFYLIEHSPSGWEDENGFHLKPVELQQQHAFSQNPGLVSSRKLHTGNV